MYNYVYVYIHMQIYIHICTTMRIYAYIYTCANQSPLIFRGADIRKTHTLTCTRFSWPVYPGSQ